MAVKALKFGLSLGSILKGTKTTSAEIAGEIATQERDCATAREGILNLEPLADAATLADDHAEADRIEGQRQAFERTIQKARLALPLLQEKLDAALLEERKAKWSEFRAAILEATDNADADAHQLSGSFTRLIGIREQAAASGFSADVSDIPLPPHLLNIAEPHTPQLAIFERSIETYRKTAPRTPTPLTPPQRDERPFHHNGAAAVRPPAPKELPIIPHGVGGGPVRNFDVGRGSSKPAAEAPAAAPKASSPSPRPAPAPMPPPPAPPPVVPAADADGNISIVVMRRGAEIAGQGRRAGEVVKVPFADAEAAVRAGIADFATEVTK